MVAVGTQLGPYKILSLIGAGGMGEVYRARDMRLGRDVAIKVLTEHFAKNEEALGRFEREARALAALSHPNILTIHDFGTQNDISYVVMELLEGEPLNVRIVRSPLPWEKALEIAIAIVSGLSAAHSKGVIHRDLKPGNIFLTSDGSVKILDFGLARMEELSSIYGDLSTPTMKKVDTNPGTIMGTVGYMSPEQVCGGFVDARSDIFSFGCVLYEMLSGKRPFWGDTVSETIAAILRDNPPKIAGGKRVFPADLERVITHCLEKNPEERFQSARDLIFALKMIAGGTRFTKPPQREQNRKQKQPRNSKAINSLAVLPFANANSDPNSDYLSDGITESIINILSQLPKLRVVPRSTVFRYKGREIDLPTVGRDLNVRAVLTGRVVHRGDTLNIQTELIDVINESQFWGQQYNRKLSDIFAVQEEIARDISEKLLLKLTGEEQKRLTKRYTESTDAYHLYLKGRYHWNKRTTEGLKRGIEYFERAIEEDPSYALAYAGLADTYALLNRYRVLMPRESFPKARAAAMRALEIDDSLAEAHGSLGLVKLHYEWDWNGAERHFRRAIELNPNYATAHQWYGGYWLAMGDFEKAIVELKRAQEIDPLSLIINADLGLPYHFARRYDLAIEQYRKVLEMDPNFYPARLYLGWAYEQKGEFQEAITEFERVSKLEDSPTASLGHAYAMAAKRDEALKLLEVLKEYSKRHYVSPYGIAMIYTGLGELDQAFEWLRIACDERAGLIVWLKVDPRIDCLRSDPRFAELLDLIGFS
jgi:eukaryotic-like serine/threonine-protein kinase